MSARRGMEKRSDGVPIKLTHSGMLDHATLIYFSEVVKRGNFGRAAAALGIQVSTISRRIARLEDDLGVTLFERGRAGLRLTAGGRAVILPIDRALSELEAVKSSAQYNAVGKVGEIRLGLRMPPVGSPLQPLLESWRIRFPDVDLRLFETTDRDLLTYLADRRVDVALMPKHSVPAHAIAEPLCREGLFLALPRRHRLVRRKMLRWQDLRSETVLVQGWDEIQTAREFYATFLGSGVRYQTHAASKQSVIALVGAGFGVTLVSRSQAEVRFPGVIFKAIAEDNAKLELDLVWLAENEDAVVGRFVAFMRDEARSRRLT